jgi:alanine-synthesizing transaminase
MIEKSNKLEGILYDIRGPVLREASLMEEEGYRIIKLNIGNPAAFGFTTPDEVIHDMIVNLPKAQGYSESKGLFVARKAVMQYCQQKGFVGVDTEDIYLGNGVSELIVMAMQGLLNDGDEVLVPVPDYPLWTAAVKLSGGKPIHYLCDEQADWNPDLNDIKSKITNRTRGIVVINPNNPTGAVYEKDVLESILSLARQYKLIVFADEIYDKILYNGAVHYSMGALAQDVVVLTFNGLSKNYRAAGLRAGWLVVSGDQKKAKGYREGLDLLSSMRLCSNVPAQYAIQTSLGGYQSINDLVKPGGRLHDQMEYAYQRLSSIPGISVVKPKGALYLFPKFDTKKFGYESDLDLIRDILRMKRILLVQGTGFNWPHPDHFRIVFLPNLIDLRDALDELEDFFLQRAREIELFQEKI